MRLALVTVLIGSVGVAVTGDLQARLTTEQQPMKMAAADALYVTVAPASFSLFTIGSLDGSQELFGRARPPGAVVHGHRVVRGRGRGDQPAAGPGARYRSGSTGWRCSR